MVYGTSLCFVVPVFAFRSPYAAVGGMTIAHGLQYLLLIGLVAGGDRGGRSRRLRLAVLGERSLDGSSRAELRSALKIVGWRCAAHCLQRRAGGVRAALRFAGAV